MEISLAGPQGASCLVTIGVVDGGSDQDFLMCSQFVPQQTNQYDFAVAAPVAVAAFAAARGIRANRARVGGAATGARTAKPKPQAKPKTKSSRRGK
jgi:hypothetical protein